jgi:hypothetical protein
VTALCAIANTRTWRHTTLLVSLVAGLSTALLFAPGLLAKLASGADGITTGTLANRLNSAFSEWWATGMSTQTSAMAEVVQFWATFHIVKAVIAAALLVALVVAVRQLLVTHARESSRVRRAGLAALGVAATLATPVILLVLLANIQGAIAPLSSVMGLLPMNPLSPALEQVREHFDAGTTTPVLTSLVDNFRSYHAAMTACAAIAAFGVVAADIALWIRVFDMPASEKRARRTSLTIALALPALALFLFVVTLANASTVVDTAPALASFFTNGQ